MKDDKTFIDFKKSPSPCRRGVRGEVENYRE